MLYLLKHLMKAYGTWSIPQFFNHKLKLTFYVSLALFPSPSLVPFPFPVPIHVPSLFPDVSSHVPLHMTLVFQQLFSVNSKLFNWNVSYNDVLITNSEHLLHLLSQMKIHKQSRYARTSAHVDIHDVLLTMILLRSLNFNKCLLQWYLW